MPKSKSKTVRTRSVSTNKTVTRPWLITIVCLLGFVSLIWPTFMLWLILSPLILVSGLRSIFLLPIILIPFVGYFIIFSLWKMKKWAFVFYMVIFAYQILLIIVGKTELLYMLTSGIITIVGLTSWNKLA